MQAYTYVSVEKKEATIAQLKLENIELGVGLSNAFKLLILEALHLRKPRQGIKTLEHLDFSQKLILA